MYLIGIIEELCEINRINTQIMIRQERVITQLLTKPMETYEYPPTIENQTELDGCKQILEKLPECEIILESDSFFRSEGWLFEDDASQELDITSFNGEIDQLYNSGQIDQSFEIVACKLTLKILQEIKSLELQDINYKTLFLEIFDCFKRILITQGPGSTYPKFYHKVMHSLTVFYGISGFIRKSPLIKKFLGTSNIIDLLVSALYHDSIMHVSYGKKQGSVFKSPFNESDSVAGVRSLQNINLTTQVSPGEFPHIISLNALWDATNFNFQETLMGILLTHYDTRSRSREVVLSNSLEVWKEEFASQELMTFIDQHITKDTNRFKYKVLQSIKPCTSLSSYILTIINVFKSEYNHLADDVETLMFERLQSFIPFQVIIAFNFKQNATFSLTKLPDTLQNLKEEFSSSTNYEHEFDTYIAWLSVISALVKTNRVESIFDLALYLESPNIWEDARQLYDALDQLYVPGTCQPLFSKPNIQTGEHVFTLIGDALSQNQTTQKVTCLNEILESLNTYRQSLVVELAVN